MDVFANAGAWGSMVATPNTIASTEEQLLKSMAQYIAIIILCQESYFGLYSVLNARHAMKRKEFLPICTPIVIPRLVRGIHVCGAVEWITRIVKHAPAKAGDG
ncbi:MAG: hypothetical protein AAB276_07910 [Pseudomonadota bacterium]